MACTDSFRPLAGIMVLIEDLGKCILVRRGIVSVPLRGLWFLSTAHRNTTLVKQLWFPSPCGDYGSYLRPSLYTSVSTSFTSFRPLAGIMVLIIEDAQELAKKCYSFRPLAGIMVLIGKSTF